MDFIFMGKAGIQRGRIAVEHVEEMCAGGLSLSETARWDYQDGLLIDGEQTTAGLVSGNRFPGRNSGQLPSSR
jgi:hypothetical protein